MNILVTNDDGYQSKGIASLARIAAKFGNVAVIAPKSMQSGMSMAVSIGAPSVGFSSLPDYVPAWDAEFEGKSADSKSSGDSGSENQVSWAWLDATPASCVKFALSDNYLPWRPDLVLSGINHGANTSAAALYSGTLGAACEGAVNNILSIGVSIDSHDSEEDLSAIEELLPAILEKLLSLDVDPSKFYYNINFPAAPASEIKGVKAACQGRGKWVREFADLGEGRYKIIGDYISDPQNRPDADHLLVKDKWISIVPHCVDTTDYQMLETLKGIF